MGHCKDCIHAKRPISEILFSAGSYEWAECDRAPVVNPVTGRTHRLFCRTARGLFGNCGPDAELFEPKQARSIAPIAAGLALAILAGALFPDAAHAAAFLERPASNVGSWLLFGALFITIALLIALALAGTGKVKSRPEDFDSAGRL